MYGKGIQLHTCIAVWICESWTPSPALLGLPPCPRNPAPPGPCSAWDLFLFCRWVHSCQALDCTYKWCHMVFVFIWFTSLSIIISRSIHVAANGIIAFFFMAEEDPISFRVHHAFFIHSSVNGHLGCFHREQCCCDQIGVYVSFPNYSFVQIHTQEWDCWIMLLLLSRFSHVRLCATP